MLSKFVTSMTARHSGAFLNRALISVPQKHFIDKLGLEGEASAVALDTKGGEVSLW